MNTDYIITDKKKLSSKKHPNYRLYTKGYKNRMLQNAYIGLSILSSLIALQYEKIYMIIAANALTP